MNKRKEPLISPGHGDGLGVKQAGSKSLVKVIDEEEEFKFCCTSLHSRYYSSQPLGLHNQEIIQSPRDALSLQALAMMGIVAPTQLPSKTELGEDVALYSPQRVMRHLGCDEGTMMVSRIFGSSKAPVAEARFIGEGKNILASFDKLFCPVELARDRQAVDYFSSGVSRASRTL